MKYQELLKGFKTLQNKIEVLENENKMLKETNKKQVDEIIRLNHENVHLQDEQIEIDSLAKIDGRLSSCLSMLDIQNEILHNICKGGVIYE